jgi:hypothetical protein
MNLRNAGVEMVTVSSDGVITARGFRSEGDANEESFLQFSGVTISTATFYYKPAVFDVYNATAPLSKMCFNNASWKNFVLDKFEFLVSTQTGSTASVTVSIFVGDINGHLIRTISYADITANNDVAVSTASFTNNVISPDEKLFLKIVTSTGMTNNSCLHVSFWKREQ